MHERRKTCIVVSGMHRSGTSALTRLLGLAGCALPKRLLKAKNGNASGHWESQPITTFHDKFLVANNSFWADWRSLQHQTFSKQKISGYCERLKMLMEKEYGDASLVVLKDPRICRFQLLTAKALELAGYDVKFVIISRKPLEVTRSLKSRDEMSDYSGHLLWLRHVLESEVQSRNFARSFVTYDELLDDWPGVLRNISENLTTTWPNEPIDLTEAIEAFLNVRQRHQKYGVIENQNDAFINGWISKTYQVLSHSRAGRLSKEDLRDLDEIRLQFDSVTPMVFGLEKDLKQNYSLLSKKVQKLEEGIIWERSQKEAIEARKQQEQSEIKETLDALEQKYSVLSDRNQTLEESIIWERSQKEAIEARNQQEQSEIKETLDALEQKYSALSDENQKLEEGIIWERSQKEAIEARKQQEQSEIKETLDALEQKYSVLSDRNQTLEESIIWERSQKEDHQEQQRNWLKQKRSLKSKFTRQKNKYVLEKENHHKLVIKSETRISDLTSEISVLEKNLQSMKEENINMKTQLAGEVSVSDYRYAVIKTLQNSTSWKMTRLPRKIIRAWRSKTLIIASLIGGPEIRNILTESEGVQKSSLHSKSASVSRARKALALSRENILESNWLKVNAGALPRPSYDALPNITICVVLYNSERWLWNFFVSVENLDYPMRKISLHFIDNGSTDKSAPAVETFIQKNRSRYSNIELFRRPNSGYGAGNDYGIRKSKDDFVLVTNVDTEFYPESLRRVVETALIDEPDVASWELRQTPYEHPKYYDPVTLLTNWSSHACVLFRRSAYLSVGGYDKKIFMYGEDVELSYRFRAHGWKLRYIPKAVILHHVDLSDNALRPHQLSGSSAANILLRYRYGDIKDIVAGEAFFRAVRRNETNVTRQEAWAETEKIVRKNRWHFIRKRKWNSKAKFPFQEFDYDVARPGADIRTKPYVNDKLHNLPLVSIVTRTHGPSDTNLRNAMASVLNQTYPAIEHIIVEDRTDDARSIVKNYANAFGDGRIRYLKSQGIGRSDCGNFGASKAKGKYICWLDNDDLFFADHIETLVRGFEKDSDAVCSYALAWEAISEIESGQPNIHTLNLPESHNRPYDKERLKKENFIPIQAILFRKELFDTYGGFNSELEQLEDWNLWVRYSECGNFAFSRRVTSLYVTPHNEKLRDKRHMELHASYENVRKLNIKEAIKIQLKST